MKRIVISLLLTVMICSLLLMSCADQNEVEPDAVELIRGEAVLMSADEKQAVYEGSFGATAQNSTTSQSTCYGVGRGINVITDPYVEVSAGAINMFDVNKLLALNWHKTFRGEMQTKSYCTNSMEDLYGSMKASFSEKLSASGSYSIFSAGLSSSFDFAASSLFKEQQNEVFYYGEQTYLGTLVEIDEYYDILKFQQIISERALADIKKVNEGTMTPKTFIDYYGTHVVLAGLYGSKIEIEYYVRNTEAQWDANMQLSMQNSVKAGISNMVEGEALTAISLESDLGLNKKYSYDSFGARCIGGKNFDGSSKENFMAEYKEWVNYTNENTDYSNLIGLPRRSLVAVWDLIPDEYVTAKGLLFNYFVKESENANGDFLNNYRRTEGTSSYASTIKTKEEFNDVLHTGEYKVTGSGRSWNKEITLKDTLEQIKESEFEKLIFDFEYELREQDDCYIFVSLYDNNGKILYYKRIEHPDGHNYKTYKFSITENIVNLPGNTFKIEIKAEDKMFKDFYVGGVIAKVTASE